MENTAAATDNPRLARRVENRLAKLSRFSDTDVMLTPGRLRKPFSQKTWRSLPADIRLAHLRVTVAKQVEEEYAERLTAKAATPEAKPTPEPVSPAPAPAPATRAAARYVSWCRRCGEEVAVHTAAPRVTFCKMHEPKQTRKRDEREDV